MYYNISYLSNYFNYIKTYKYHHCKVAILITTVKIDDGIKIKRF